MRHWKAPSQKQSWRCRSARVAWRNATVYACTIYSPSRGPSSPSSTACGTAPRATAAASSYCDTWSAARRRSFGTPDHDCVPVAQTGTCSPVTHKRLTLRAASHKCGQKAIQFRLESVLHLWWLNLQGCRYSSSFSSSAARAKRSCEGSAL